MPDADTTEVTAAIEATTLRCQRFTEPLGIDEEAPVFGWAPHGGCQSAYQVVVGTDPAAVAEGRGDLWDSGRVESSAVAGIAYAGIPLASRTRTWWTVRLWDDSGAGPMAPPASFEVGLRRAEDWRAGWIAGAAGVSSPLLRTEFTLPAPVRRARAYVSALGFGELRLNGEKVGDGVLDPPQTSYEHDPELLDGHGEPARMTGARVLYATHDVTGLLRAGANAVGVILGHGWYSAEEDIGTGPLPRTPWGDRPRGIVQIEAELEDDSTVVLGSDGGWRWAAGPIAYNDFAHGETYDARAEQAGWDAPGFDDAAWAPVEACAAPDADLRALSLEPSRVVDTLAPIGSRTAASGALLLDFGQHVSGWTRIAVAGPPGAAVTLRHAGELTAAGELDDDANANAWMPARQTDVYVVRGDGIEHWEPRFTLHGFRHVEVACSSPEVKVHAVEARVVHSDLRRIGDFECSDGLLNQIHANVQWTHRASFQGCPQDAAERNERVGWVGDPGWAVEDYLYNFDATAFWLKWLDDLADGQLPSGVFPVICPVMWRGGIDMLARAEEAGEDVTEVPDDFETMSYWPFSKTVDFSGSSFPSIAWELYRHTGDRAILERSYEPMRRGADYVRSLAEGNIVAAEHGLGDHMEPQPDGTCDVFPRRTPVDMTSTAWLYRNVSIVAETAALIGEEEDARSYAAVAAEVRAAFNERFYDRERGVYGTGTQTSLALPLWFGLVEEGERERVLAALVEQIRAKDGHLETGTMGTAALQQVLGPCGRADVMLEIATQTTYPSWGHQVAQGATTVWETWGGDATLSRNMKLMASIEPFLYRDVAGLAPASPGWERILVRPRLTDKLGHARASVETVRGRAAVSWRVDDGVIELDVEVPASSTAEVWLPRAGGEVEIVELAGGAHRLRGA